MIQSASLNVQFGPVVAHADGPMAMIALSFIAAIYVLGPLVVEELFRRMNRRSD